MGEVGQAAHSVISEADIDAVTIDIDDHQGVDIVADAGSKAVLQDAEIGDAEAIIIGLPDDSASLLTTVLARSLDPSIEVLTRVSDTDATRKALSAGADYVLSVPRVSARMIAKELRGEDVLAPASQIRFVRVSASPFAGSTLAESGIFEETGCRVIAIEDDSGLSNTLDPQRQFTGDERVIIVGSDESVQQFLKQFDVSPTEAAEQSELSSERAPD
jgi:Trk K+ transport system NAD-binding subunit